MQETEQQEQTAYTLSDRTIAMIVQLLQLGILTGTDVSDHFRTLRVVPGDGGKLEPEPQFEAQFEENLRRMREEASQVDPDAN